MQSGSPRPGRPQPASNATTARSPSRTVPASTDVAISSITLAELAAGPHATNDPAERSRRQDRLQRTEAAYGPLPFDADAARAYGRIFAAVAGAERNPRGARAVDLLIAATALAARLPLYTRTPDDFEALDNLADVAAI